MRRLMSLLGGLALTLALTGSVHAGPFSFSTGDPDGKMAMASRPDSPAGIEIEVA